MEFSIKRNIDKLGRIVIPVDLRDHYGIEAGDTIEIFAEKDGIFIKASKDKVVILNSTR